MEQLSPDQLSLKQELALIFPGLSDETLNHTVLDHRNKNDLELCVTYLLDHSSNCMEQLGATSDNLKLEFEEQLSPDQLSLKQNLSDIFPDISDDELYDIVFDRRNKKDLELCVTYLLSRSNDMEKLGATSDMTFRAEIREALRIVLIGKSGSGKSSTGNTILGEELFKTGFSASSVTQNCQEVLGLSCGQNIQLIDTPGIFDTDRPNAQVLQEIARCISMSLPGPHVFLLLLQAGRFTPEENDTVNHFAEMFGEDGFEHMILVFTGRDTLEKNKQTLDEFLQTIPPSLAGIREKCSNRCVAIDNSAGAMSRNEDARNLIKEINVLVKKHNGKYYTNEMFKAAEKKCREREEEIRRQKDQEKEEEKQKMKEQFNKEFKRQFDDMEAKQVSLEKAIRDCRTQKEMLEEKMQDLTMKDEEIATMKEKIRSIETEAQQYKEQAQDAKHQQQVCLRNRDRHIMQQSEELDRQYLHNTNVLIPKSRAGAVFTLIQGAAQLGWGLYNLYSSMDG